MDDKLIIDLKNTPFKDYKKEDWALFFIETLGCYDGSHHKEFALDQVARVLHNTNVIVSFSSERGFMVDLDKPSREYIDWVKKIEDGEDGEKTYLYNTGVAP